MESEKDGEKKRKKRDHGQGGVYFIKSRNEWLARLTKNKHQYGKYFKTEKEAKAHLKTLTSNQKELEQNWVTTTVKEYIQQWLIVYKKNNLALRSYDTLEYDIKNYVLPYIQYIPLCELRNENIQRMINGLLDAGYSKSVIKRSFSAINSCCKHALKEREIPYNPCSGSEMPLEKRHEQLKPKDIIFFNDEQVKAYCRAAIEKYPNGTPIYRIGWGCIFILFTGLRRGEACALRWTDVDFENNVINIGRNIVTTINRDEETNKKKKHIKVEQNSTKSASGIRQIPLNKNSIEALIHLKELNGKYDFVLATRNGTSQDENTLLRTHKSIAKKINEPCGIHSLRHTFASMLFKQGNDIKKVQEILGHKDFSTTMQIYVHVYPEQKAAALKSIEIDFMDD